MLDHMAARKFWSDGRHLCLSLAQRKPPFRREGMLGFLDPRRSLENRAPRMACLSRRNAAGAGAPPPLDSESVNKTTQSSPSFFVAEGLQDIEGEVALCVAALDVVRSDKNVQLVLSSNDIDAVMLALACTELPLDTIVMRSNRMPAQTTTLNQAKEEFV